MPVLTAYYAYRTAKAVEAARMSGIALPLEEALALSDVRVESAVSPE